MKIRVKTSVADIRWSVKRGIYEVPEELSQQIANELLSAGYAEKILQQDETDSSAEAESATVAARMPARHRR